MSETGKAVNMTGKQLKALREVPGWNQAQMGKAQGFAQSSIANMESGRRGIPFDAQTAKARMIAQLDRDKEGIEKWIC